MAFKTPGVYTIDVSGQRPPGVPIDTAVPVFLGYTEKTEGAGELDLKQVAVRITSLEEYQQIFGRGQTISKLKVVLDLEDIVPLKKISFLDMNALDQRFYLYESIELFFANGGGSCYIASLGDYTSTVSKDDFENALELLEKYEEPTLVVLPDAVNLDAQSLGELQQDVLAHCALMINRFAILDVRDGDKARLQDDDPIASYREYISGDNLRYGAAYYPWIIKNLAGINGTFSLDNFELVDPAGLPIPLTVFADILDEQQGMTLHEQLDLSTQIRQAFDAAVASITSSTSFVKSQLQADFNHKRSLLRWVDLNASRRTVNGRAKNLMACFRNVVLSFARFESEYKNIRVSCKEVNAVLSKYQGDTILTDIIKWAVGFEKNPDVHETIHPDYNPEPSNTQVGIHFNYAVLNRSNWILPKGRVEDIVAHTDNFGDGLHERARGWADDSDFSAHFTTTLDKLFLFQKEIFEAADSCSQHAEQQLFQAYQLFNLILEEANRKLGGLPPSGAIAGIITRTDHSQGPWKAPANAIMEGVIGPSVIINAQQQADLNVHHSGKSINAIRAFRGRGTVVWGARTLKGNDLEWRHIPVRRLFIMVEDFVRRVARRYVFEPNTRTTWLRLRAIIEDYLEVQWRKGAMFGDKAGDAFFVKVGLGDTMSAQDINEGRLIIEIGLAAVRPAEFIVLKYEQLINQ